MFQVYLDPPIAFHQDVGDLVHPCQSEGGLDGVPLVERLQNNKLVCLIHFIREVYCSGLSMKQAEEAVKTD